MIAETVILIRTPGFDDRLGHYARRLEKLTGYPVCFAMDETQGAVPMPDDLLKLSFNHDATETLNLLRPEGYNWRCGDYLFYLARQRFPFARWFWQVEPDVRINFADEGAFFRRYAPYPEIDFLAAYLTEADPQWNWRRAMEPFASRVFRCFFPIVRLSAPAIDHLLSRRQELTALFGEDRPTGMWPNDEVFVATELASGDWRCADLNFGGTVCGPDSFEYYRAFSDSMFTADDDRLYHSVQRGAGFVARLDLCLHAATASWTSPAEKQWITAMLRRPSLATEIARETSEAEAARFMAALDGLAKSNQKEDAIKAPPIESKRGEVVRLLWRGQDPLIGFPIRLFEADTQGWFSQHPYLAETIAQARPALVVEVGVWKGASTITLADAIKRLNLNAVVIAVDTWLGAWDHWIKDEWHPHLNPMYGLPTLYFKFIGNVMRSGLKDYIVPLPLDSVNAANVLRHYELHPDLVHLDGAHDYRSVRADLEEWWPLITPGGWLIGDDYGDWWPDVNRAYDEFFGALGLHPFESEGNKCRIQKPLGREDFRR